MTFAIGYKLSASIKTALVALLFASVFMASVPAASTYAATDILNEACQTAPDSTACKDRVGTGDPNPLTGTNGVLLRVARIVSGIAGVIAVIIVVIAGFRYVTSGGDAQKAGEAKKTIIGAIVGLIVIVAAQAIITLVIKELR